MGDHTAFFYGTLMAPEVLHRVCYGPGAVGNDPAKTFLASQLLVQPAILHDYCRHRVRGCDYPGIVPETGHTVRGTFVTGLTDGDIFRLDAFEGNEYERIKVKVELVEVSGRFVEASTYMYAAGEECLEKKEWSYEEFRRDKIHRWADDSNEYQQVDDAVEGDPTGGRHIKTDIHASTYTKLAEDKKALNAAV
ncbi:AIG2-like family-domain-containing protein [Hyaloscypha sp. PMI_1271]|nr:AIG2-like family-domain-containing protein [Hyaloscypha sp. PMI_1271]